MPVVQLLREHGIVWQEPTVAAVRKAIDDATVSTHKPFSGNEMEMTALILAEEAAGGAVREARHQRRQRKRGAPGAGHEGDAEEEP